MLVHYSIVELLMVFEVSAQRERTIVATYLCTYVATLDYYKIYICVVTKIINKDQF